MNKILIQIICSLITSDYCYNQTIFIRNKRISIQIDHIDHVNIRITVNKLASLL
jgi:uncharacterized membrane protein